MLKIDNEFILMKKEFVYSIINDYANDNNREDLYQVGMLAIVKAADLFDPDKGVKFTTYAYKHILGEVLKYIRENKNIKPSRETIREYVKILKIKDYVYKTEGRRISNEELSKLMGISEVKINEIENACSVIESLDSYVDSDESYSFHETIAKKENIDKNDLIELKYALESLNEEERKFIYERYFENKTQTEIAKEQNTNQVKIYRYEKELLDRLNSKMAA